MGVSAMKLTDAVLAIVGAVLIIERCIIHSYPAHSMVARSFGYALLTIPYVVAAFSVCSFGSRKPGVRRCIPSK